MSFRNILCSLLPCFFLGAAVAAAQVAPTSVFQLDGNPANDHLGVDYFNLLNGPGSATASVTVSQTPPTAAGNWSVRTYVPGVFDTFNFTTGGSKDPNLISQWAYTSTSTPNKDALNAVYAAAYVATGHFVLIFGADRLSPNGDANIGLWFFQGPVGPNGSGGFTGAHTNGDLFVISAFTGGGGTSTITVYAWNQPGLPGAINGGCSTGVKNPTAGQCADTNLLLLAAPTTVCGSAIFCAITNANTVTASWATTANGYTVPQVAGGGQLVSPLFFEGGMDVTAVLNSVGITTIPCFSSFLMETRSSQSTTAVLKDFLTGSFPICGLNITKSCGTPAAVQAGTEINYPVNGVVTNTGIGALYNVSVFDTPTSPAGATRPAILVSNNVMGSANFGTSTLGPGETGTWADSTITTAASASDSAVAQGGATASVVPNGNPSQPGTVTSANVATATCQSNFETPLKVTKNCGIPAGPNNTPPAIPGVTLTSNGTSIGVLVSYSGTVCNNGVSTVTGVALTDKPNAGPSGPITIGVLPACTSFDASGNCTETDGANCRAYSSNYTPTNLDAVIAGLGGPSTGPGRYSWSDLITISSATSDIGKLCKIGDPSPCPQYSSPPSGTSGTFGFATAACPICQGPGECTP
jgi:hypothetical protein